MPSRNEQFSHALAQGLTSTFIGGQDIDPALIAYIGADNLGLKTNAEAADLLSLLAYARRKIFGTLNNKKLGERRRVIIDDGDDYGLDNDLLALDDDLPSREILEIVELIQGDIEDAESEDRIKWLRSLKARIHTFFMESGFRNALDLNKQALAMDGRSEIGITRGDIADVVSLLENRDEAFKKSRISPELLETVRMFIAEDRFIAILGSIYRGWTPQQLLRKLKALELRLIEKGVIGDTRESVQGQFSDRFLNLDHKGNIPFPIEEQHADIAENLFR